MSKSPAGVGFISGEKGNWKYAACVLCAHLCTDESYNKAILINVKSLPPFFFKKGGREVK